LVKLPPSSVWAILTPMAWRSALAYLVYRFSGEIGLWFSYGLYLCGGIIRKRELNLWQRIYQKIVSGPICSSPSYLLSPLFIIYQRVFCFKLKCRMMKLLMLAMTRRCWIQLDIVRPFIVKKVM